MDKIYFSDFSDVIQNMSPQLKNKNINLIFDFFKQEDKIYLEEEDFVRFYLFFNNKVINN